jgi:hypothetical protein
MDWLTKLKKLAFISKFCFFSFNHVQRSFTIFSEIYCARNAPPSTAIPVAMTCPKIAPVATPKGA